MRSRYPIYPLPKCLYNIYTYYIIYHNIYNITSIYIYIIYIRTNIYICMQHIQIFLKKNALINIYKWLPMVYLLNSLIVSIYLISLVSWLKRWKVFWQDCQVRSTLKIYYNPSKSRFYWSGLFLVWKEAHREKSI